MFKKKLLYYVILFLNFISALNAGDKNPLSDIIRPPRSAFITASQKPIFKDDNEENEYYESEQSDNSDYSDQDFIELAEEEDPGSYKESTATTTTQVKAEWNNRREKIWEEFLEKYPNEDYSAQELTVFFKTLYPQGYYIAYEDIINHLNEITSLCPLKVEKWDEQQWKTFLITLKNNFPVLLKNEIQGISKILLTDVFKKFDFIPVYDHLFKVSQKLRIPLNRKVILEEWTIEQTQVIEKFKRNHPSFIYSEEDIIILFKALYSEEKYIPYDDIQTHLIRITSICPSEVKKWDNKQWETFLLQIRNNLPFLSKDGTQGTSKTFPIMLFKKFSKEFPVYQALKKAWERLRNHKRYKLKEHQPYTKLSLGERKIVIQWEGKQDKLIEDFKLNHPDYNYSKEKLAALFKDLYQDDMYVSYNDREIHIKELLSLCPKDGNTWNNIQWNDFVISLRDFCPFASYKKGLLITVEGWIEIFKKHKNYNSVYSNLYKACDRIRSSNRFKRKREEIKAHKKNLEITQEEKRQQAKKRKIARASSSSKKEHEEENEVFSSNIRTIGKQEKVWENQEDLKLENFKKAHPNYTYTDEDLKDLLKDIYSEDHFISYKARKEHFDHIITLCPGEITEWHEDKWKKFAKIVIENCPFIAFKTKSYLTAGGAYQFFGSLTEANPIYCELSRIYNILRQHDRKQEKVSFRAQYFKPTLWADEESEAEEELLDSPKKVETIETISKKALRDQIIQSFKQKYPNYKYPWPKLTELLKNIYPEGFVIPVSKRIEHIDKILILTPSHFTHWSKEQWDKFVEIMMDHCPFVAGNKKGKISAKQLRDCLPKTSSLKNYTLLRQALLRAKAQKTSTKAISSDSSETAKTAWGLSRTQLLNNFKKQHEDLNYTCEELILLLKSLYSSADTIPLSQRDNHMRKIVCLCPLSPDNDWEENRWEKFIQIVLENCPLLIKGNERAKEPTFLEGYFNKYKSDDWRCKKLYQVSHRLNERARKKHLKG